MPNEAKCLWGDLSWVQPLIEKHKESPFYLLAEQGKILANLTKGALYGRVSISQNNAEGTTLLFSLEAPARNYVLQLFSVVQTRNIYPLTIIHPDEEAITLCDNEEEFLEALEQELSSKRTLELIAILQTLIL